MIQIDMPMPENCSECRFATERGFCKAKPEDFCGYTDDTKRPDWCPLEEHGAKPPRVYENAYGRKFYHCPRCNRTFDCFNKESYCHDCGQAVKWE